MSATLASRVGHLDPFFLALLAEAFSRVGNADDGLASVVKGMALVEKNKATWWMAELHRLKGELLLKLPPENIADAETCYKHALEVARNQEAKSLELRAAMSMSRLWQQHGKRDEARQMLAEIYGWFTEGFDTADLKEAKVLLEELA
jgi:predicted ATPase